MPPDHPPPSDHYATLGVPEGAPHLVLHRAYRDLMRTTHPDVAAGDPDANTRALEANAAWAVLRDPVLRAAYDRTRASRRAAAGARAATGPGAGATPVERDGTPAERLREDARASAAYSESRRATSRAYAAASLRAGLLVVLIGGVLLAAFLRG